MNDIPEICPRCRKSRLAGSGRITQWISKCFCNEPTSAATGSMDTESSLDLELCLECGKRKNRGRDGSMTQFVFRQDLCRCGFEGESGKQGAGMALQDTELEIGSSANELEDEATREVYSRDFPYGRFKPIKELGRGGGGSVYLARDLTLGKMVAVKVLHTLSEEQLVMFQKEAKATSRLSHPHIISILDFGADNDTPYMVLEYFAGRSMDVFMRDNGPLEPEQALSIFSKVASALAFAHREGIYHRDLKPSNILISESGDIRIIDFGVAYVKQATQEPTLFQGRSIAGTPAYMSPDVVLGNDYSERSEIYSLGCVLFEALAGRPPFVAESALETMSMQAHEPPPVLSDFRELDSPWLLEAIISRCLEKSADLRFSSMDELGAELLTSHPPERQSDRGAQAADQTEPTPGVDTNPSRSPMTLTVISLIGIVSLGLVGLLLAKNLSADIPSFGSGEVSDDATYLLDSNAWIEGSTSKYGMNHNILVDDEFHAAYGDWTGVDVDEFLKGRKVRRLVMGERIGMPFIKQLHKLKEIVYLDFEYTAVDDSVLTEIVGLNKLEVLSFNGSQVSDAGLLQLKTLKRLRKLYVYENSASEATKAELAEALPNCQIVFLGPRGRQEP